MSTHKSSCTQDIKCVFSHCDCQCHGFDYEDPKAPKSTYDEMMEEDPEGMLQAERELEDELKNYSYEEYREQQESIERRVAAVEKGSPAEIKQAWKSRAEAN